MPQKQSILVVEDELPIRTGLCDVLAFHGYAPVGVEDGVTALREARNGSFALMLLDIMLPQLNGFDVCEQLRETHRELPVLMLTAKGSEEDILRGFRVGADDYVAKPFSVAEVLARVSALLRRSSAASASQQSEFTVGPIRIDPEQCTAVHNGATIALTRREIELLAIFAREAGRIVSRRTLLREVWGFQNAERIETRTIDVHVAKLRKKLGIESSTLIETIRGEGYRFGG